jgi:hypothetical protein
MKGQYMRKTIMALGGLAFVAACAQPPSAIAPTSMGGMYNNISCQEAQVMLAQERQTLASLEQSQRNAVAQDAAGVFLILVPVSSLTGANVAGDLAISKGKVQALEARLLSC